MYKFSRIDLLKNETILRVDPDKYIKAELRTTTLPSRIWMNHGMAIAKEINFAPANGARFYSYIASVYSDVLKVSNSNEASLATAQIINILVPDKKLETDKVLAQFNFPESLTLESKMIFDKYKKRLTSDNYELVWDKKTTKDKWFIRDDEVDKGAMAGEWQTWIIDDTDIFDIPSPPKNFSFLDKLEIEKVKYAVRKRSLDDMYTIYFWHGSTGFEKGAGRDNITPAGVWQNILYVEIPRSNKNEPTDEEYANAQKILAQSIADSFIKAWQVKYEFLTKRPSMRINKLYLLVADPPFPSYVSGHAMISATAATVLSSLYPSKKQIWMDNLYDARNSRLLGGIHFDIDNKVGQYLGQQIGSVISKKVLDFPVDLKKETSGLVESNNYLKNTIQLFLFKLQPVSSSLVGSVLSVYHNYIDKPHFNNVIMDSGIKMTSPSAGASFADYDNDGDLDLFTAGLKNRIRLYKNEGGGKFVDVTEYSQIKNDISGLVFSGIFGDYDNDGCSDLFMTGSPDYVTKESNTWLYKNNCDGTFKDVTSESGIDNPYNGRGSNWVDYDNDGDLDIYIANEGVFPTPDVYFYEPNILYRNNNNGTFTNVTNRSGVEGAIGTMCGKPQHTIKVNGPDLKISFQPIWFDYNNDNLNDLFIATDTGISPLYKNNGNGTFKNVTVEAGLCKWGTGMGVTAGDYDNDGDLDIYVTNVGQNYFWENNDNGTFSENSKISGVDDRSSLGWGTGFFDYDNDGSLDLYVVNGDVVGDAYRPEVGKIRIDKLYHNTGNKKFISVAESEGISGDDPKEAVAFGDYDNNGFVDLFTVTSRKEKESKSRLYQNSDNKNHWLTLKLVGTKSNRDAVGAKIFVIAGGVKQMRQVISGSSYLSQDSLWPTFGVGINKKIDEVKIIWPSGTIQSLLNVDVDQLITVKES